MPRACKYRAYKYRAPVSTAPINTASLWALLLARLIAGAFKQSLSMYTYRAPINAARL